MDGINTDWLTGVIKQAGDTYYTIRQGDALKSQQYSQYADAYYPLGQPVAGAIAGINPTVLLLMGAALVAVFVLKN